MWLTEQEIHNHVASCCSHARDVEPGDLDACEAVASGISTLLAAARDTAELLPLPIYYAVLDNERAPLPGERKLPTWRPAPDEPFTIDIWHMACKRDVSSDHARLVVTRFYTEWWAPRKAVWLTLTQKTHTSRAPWTLS